MPELSIIILTWNTAQVTLNCVKSLQNKLKNIKYEIIVVDNGSTDNTNEIFSNLKNIKYLNTGSNLGFSKGNNFGAKHSTGKYLLFLNSDMEYISGLDKMFNHYIQNKVGLIGPQFLNTDLSSQGSIFPPQTITNAFKQFWLGLPTYNKYFLNTTSVVNAISGGAILISREFFNQLGMWNEKYFFYYEDMDLCRSVRTLKRDIVYFPECKFIHHHGASVKKITGTDSGTKRLVSGSKLFNGVFIHYVLNFVIWSGQKLHRLLKY